MMTVLELSICTVQYLYNATQYYTSPVFRVSVFSIQLLTDLLEPLLLLLNWCFTEISPVEINF